MGGQNLYTYAPNPVTWIDLWGLALEGVDFTGSPDLYPITGRQQDVTQIVMQGTRSRDFTLAYQQAGFTPAEVSMAKDAGYTWHHVRDSDPETGKTTMQLVKRSAHEATYPHAGSVEQFEKYLGVKYGPEGVKAAEQKGWLKGRKLNGCK